MHICKACSHRLPCPEGVPWSVLGEALWATRVRMGWALMGPLGPHAPRPNGSLGCNSPRKSWGTPSYLFPFDHADEKTPYI